MYVHICMYIRTYLETETSASALSTRGSIFISRIYLYLINQHPVMGLLRRSMLYKLFQVSTFKYLLHICMYLQCSILKLVLEIKNRKMVDLKLGNDWESCTNYVIIKLGNRWNRCALQIHWGWAGV
jgi:hypothetical protein